MKFKDILKNKKILFGLIIFVMLIILVIFRWVWESNIAGKIEVLIAPRSGNITLNGKKISNGVHYLNPGKYTIKADHREFIEKSLDFEIKSKEFKKITFALNTKDGTDNWYLRDRQDDIIRGGAGYENIRVNMDKLTKNSPIAKKLPYKDTLKSRFTISYSTDKNGEYVESIDVNINSCYNKNSSIDSEEYRKSRAKSWIDNNLKDQEKGKYKINYTVNPCIIN
ncbi:MAG: hypothetical protein Q4A21_03455 [bacterium]|nr:hypothetical protein [bacterium]